MKSRMLFFGLILGFCLPSTQAQDIDVTQLLADSKTFIFSNNKNTVKGYIYAELEQKSSCCGSDRIYLEVRIDPSGYVTQAKTLTGKNECFKQSAIDIVKNVKWDAKDLNREKSVYFEIKPEIDCQAGSKSNNYAQIEIFNNELLDKQGNRTGAVIAASQPTAPTPKPAEVASANITPPAGQPAAKQPEPVKPATDEPATTSQPVAPATTEPAATPAKTQPQPTTQAQPIASNEGASRSNNVTPTSESNFSKTGDRVALESNVQDEEIRILKEKMEAARAKEEAAREREKQIREEQARREREKAEREKASKQETDKFAGRQGEGGLFFDERTDQGGPGRTQGGDPGASQEQRTREDIQRLEQQLREIEERNRQRDNELRAKERDDQLAAQEMIRIREEIIRKQEEMERNREQQELDRIAQDRRRAEEEQRKYEEEVRRMMDEIARLQAESERKMQELQRQKVEMDRLAQLQIQREQENILQQQIRKKQQDLEIEQMRQLAMGNTSSRGLTASAVPSLPPTFSIPNVDSASKLDMILMQLSVLQQELIRVQTEMANLRAGGGSITPAIGPARGSTTTPTRPATPTQGGAKNAATDKSWEKIDTGVPGGSRGGASVPVDPARFDPVRGYSPAASHADSYANVTVARFPSPTSGQGQGDMKDYIKEELRKRGVCGLAQALAEVTIDPKGDVTRYNVIKANDLQVSGALPGILQGMKFEPSELDVPYVSYIEFKADILCEGRERINIREVGDYIEAERP